MKKGLRIGFAQGLSALIVMAALLLFERNADACCSPCNNIACGEPFQDACCNDSTPQCCADTWQCGCNGAYPVCYAQFGSTGGCGAQIGHACNSASDCGFAGLSCYQSQCCQPSCNGKCGNPNNNYIEPDGCGGFIQCPACGEGLQCNTTGTCVPITPTLGGGFVGEGMTTSLFAVLGMLGLTFVRTQARRARTGAR
jgi:hypothetical protein